MNGAEPVVCAICGDAGTREVFPGARPHPLVACARCGLVFQPRAPVGAAVDALYADAYAEPRRRFAGPVERAVRLFRLSRVWRAQRLLPPGGRVLDVGCGRAVFLHLLQRRGYRVRGTELSASTAANAHPDVPVDTGDLRPGRYPRASFDLISIWHVLEHLREPQVTLRACREALAPGGALLVAVPNFGSLQARLGGPHWFHLDLPRHVFQFTPDTLSRLLETCGFAVERCRTGQWEMDPFGLLQTALNRAGLRPNGLYDTLRRHPDAMRDLSPARRAALLALFPAGMALAAPVSLAARWLGRAGTIIALARPRDGGA